MTVEPSQADAEKPAPRERFRISRRRFLQSAGILALAAGGYKLFDWAAPLARGEEKVTGKDQIATLVPSICGMCTANCGILVYVENGQPVKIEGNYRHSHSHGRLCARGSAGIKVAQNWQRLKGPLKRGPIEGSFQQIGWDQAFQEIGAKLTEIKNAYGPESLAWICGPRLSQAWDRHFVKAFGSPNFFSTESLYRSPVTVASRYTTGSVPIPDIASSRFILAVGRDYAENTLVRDLEDLMQAREKGASLVVVDPRLTRTAAQADEWIPIRPGTEGVLLLALAHVIIAENLYDASFVSSQTYGFEQFKSLALDVSPDWAALVSGVPTHVIRRLAYDLAKTKPSCFVDVGFTAPWEMSYKNSVQTVRAALALNALLGNYNAPGGLIMPPDMGDVARFQLPKTDPVKPARADGAGTLYPVAPESEGIVQFLPEVILSQKPYPIRALVVDGFNPALDLPNSSKVIKALKRLELLVVIDFQGSETADLAHYVLAESSYLERYDPVAVSQRSVAEIALRQPIIPPQHDTKPAYEIIANLAEEAGLGGSFDFTLEDVLEQQLAATHLSLEAFKKTGVWQPGEGTVSRSRGFQTPSGKVELFSEKMKSLGCDPLPAYVPPAEEPHSQSFRLLTGSEPVHTGSVTQNNPWLNSLSTENALWMNADRAARMAISDGDMVLVRSRTGELEVRARLTQGIHPEAAFLARGFGHNSPRQRLSYQKGANVNTLIEDRVEPVGGIACTGETIVTIVKRR